MNNRGSILISVLVLTPLLVVVLATSIGSSILMRNQEAIIHRCRTGILDAEDFARRNLQTLINMNPQAAELRLQRTLAETEVTMARGFPAALGPALAHLQNVTTRQLIFHSSQLSLLRATELGAQIKIRKLQADLTQLMQKLQIHFADKSRQTFDIRHGMTFLPTGLLSLAVMPRPALSASPDYVPVTDFSERQTYRVLWTFRILALLPNWMRVYISTNHTIAHGQCAATIEKGPTGWLLRLEKDKPLWN